MSEYKVDAYFLEKKIIQESIGSKSQELKEKVLADKSSIISDNSSRFSGKKLEDAVSELIDGDIQEGYPFHYSFATWALIDAISSSRPKEPWTTGYPFVDLYDFDEILENENIYPNLKLVLGSLNGDNMEFDLPVNIGEWGEMPCITYLEKVDESIFNEANQMKKDIENEEDWTFEFENDFDDIVLVLSWLIEAYDLDKSICLVMDGDL